MSKQPNGWTDDEIAALQEHYGKVPSAKMMELIPTRSWKAIKAYGCKLGKTTPRPSTWTPEQTAILIEHYPLLGAEAVAKMIGRPASSVWHRAADLKVKVRNKKPVEVKAKKPKPMKAIKFKASGFSVRIEPSKLRGEPIITASTKVTIAPPFVDKRWIADSVQRVVDSSQCREWAANA